MLKVEKALSRFLPISLGLYQTNDHAFGMTVSNQYLLKKSQEQWCHNLRINNAIRMGNVYIANLM